MQISAFLNWAFVKWMAFEPGIFYIKKLWVMVWPLERENGCQNYNFRRLPYEAVSRYTRWGDEEAPVLAVDRGIRSLACQQLQILVSEKHGAWILTFENSDLPHFRHLDIPPRCILFGNQGIGKSQLMSSRYSLS